MEARRPPPCGNCLYNQYVTKIIVLGHVLDLTGRWLRRQLMEKMTEKVLMPKMAIERLIDKKLNNHLILVKGFDS